MDFLHSPLWNFIVWISTILSLIVAIGTIIEWVLKLKTPARSVRAYTYSYFKSIRYSRTFIDRFSAFLPITSFLFLVFLILLAITQFMSRSYLSAFLISSLVIVLFVR